MRPKPGPLAGVITALVLAALASLPAQAQGALKKVRLAEVIRSILYAPEYVALGRGFAKEQGLDVDLSVTNGGDKGGALLLSGGADILLAGPEVPIYIFNGESPLKMVVFCALTGTDGFFLESRKKVDHFDWNSLRGASVLGWRPGSTPEFFLEYVMKQHGIDPKSVDIITNIGIPARIGAWQTGTMPFGIFQEPEISQILEPAGYQIVASDGKEVGRADYTMFMATTTFLKAHPDIAQAWTNAIAQAQAWMTAQPAAVVAGAIKDYFPSVPPAVLASSIERYRSWGAPYWADSPVVLPQGLAKIEDIMVSGGVLPANKRVKYQDIVTTQFADAARAKYLQSAK